MARRGAVSAAGSCRDETNSPIKSQAKRRVLSTMRARRADLRVRSGSCAKTNLSASLPCRKQGELRRGGGWPDQWGARCSRRAAGSEARAPRPQTAHPPDPGWRRSRKGLGRGFRRFWAIGGLGGLERRLGGFLRATGGFLRAAGGAPRVTGDAPRVTGDVPRVTGDAPREAGERVKRRWGRLFRQRRAQRAAARPSAGVFQTARSWCNRRCGRDRAPCRSPRRRR